MDQSTTELFPAEDRNGHGLLCGHLATRQSAAAPHGQSGSQPSGTSAPQVAIARLTIAHALSGANTVVIYATGAIVGAALAPRPALATLPISMFALGMVTCILPLGVVARSHGRSTTFMAGAICGVIAGLTAMFAIISGSFSLFCFATFLGGAYAAVVLSYRFAAADCVAADQVPFALSVVMAGGIAAGIFGPHLVTRTMAMWPGHMFAATYLVQAAVALLAGAVLAGIRLPRPAAGQMAAGRPLAQIARQPRFIAAVTCGAVSYMLMNFVMTAAPLAMRICGHSQQTANLGVQWHVIAMYAPSLASRWLIDRFGSVSVAGAGVVLTALSIVVGLGGVDLAHFWTALILLGVGWNFGFIGASALVLECHRFEERIGVQSLNDFLVFGMMAVGAMSSGGVLAAFGWGAVLWAAFSPLTIAIAALIATVIVQRIDPDGGAGA